MIGMIFTTFTFIVFTNAAFSNTKVYLKSEEYKLYYNSFVNKNCPQQISGDLPNNIIENIAKQNNIPISFVFPRHQSLYLYVKVNCPSGNKFTVDVKYRQCINTELERDAYGECYLISYENNYSANFYEDSLTLTDGIKYAVSEAIFDFMNANIQTIRNTHIN